MFDWIRRILSGRRKATQPPVHYEGAPVNITVSHYDTDKLPARIRSPALAQLWHEVSSLSHPDYPFLDRAYSPGSLMPCADVSTWAVERLAAGDRDSLWELLGFIAADDQISELRRTVTSYDPSRFIDAEPPLLLELEAITILIYRIPWTGHEDSRRSLLALLFEHSLGSYPFTVRQAAAQPLCDAANKVIRQRNREFKELRPPEPLLKAETLVTGLLPEVSAVGQELRRFPITFRACISYSLDRGSPVPGTIRPQLQGEYGLRQFGLCGRQNSQFFAQCGIFEAPSDLCVVAARLSKDELLQLAAPYAVEIVKSWKKQRIIEALLGLAETRSAIAVKAFDNLVQVRPEVGAAFDAWRARVAAVKNFALCLSCA
jgi:hypothetical protein